MDPTALLEVEDDVAAGREAGEHSAARMDQTEELDVPRQGADPRHPHDLVGPLVEPELGVRAGGDPLGHGRLVNDGAVDRDAWLLLAVAERHSREAAEERVPSTRRLCELYAVDARQN